MGILMAIKMHGTRVCFSPWLRGMARGAAWMQWHSGSYLGRRLLHIPTAPRGPSRPAAASAAGRELKQGIRRRIKRNKEEGERTASVRPPAKGSHASVPLFAAALHTLCVRATPWGTLCIFIHVRPTGRFSQLCSIMAARKANKLTCGLGFF
jgi:hypothetical protein